MIHNQVCLPGLHITLGVFFRLFSLLEDQCHALDLELATSQASSSGDRPSYATYTRQVQEERTLLDQKEKIEGEVSWLQQTLSFLAINSSNPASDPAMLAVTKVIKDKNMTIGHYNEIHCFSSQMNCQEQEGGRSLSLLIISPCLLLQVL